MLGSVGLFTSVIPKILTSGSGTTTGVAGIPLATGDQKPEDNINPKTLPDSTVLSEHRNLSSLLTTIKEAYFEYFRDKPEEAKKYTDKHLKKWKIKNVKNLVKWIKANWWHKKVRRVFGPVLFNIRIALIANQPKASRPSIAGLEEGNVYLTRVSLFTIDKAHTFNAPAGIWDKKAWDVKELKPLKKQIKALYASLGHKWNDKFENYTAKSLVSVYKYLLNLRDNNPRFKTKISTYIPLLKVTLSKLGLLSQTGKSMDFVWFMAQQARANKTLNKPVWNLKAFRQLKGKFSAAYKKAFGRELPKDWKLQNILIIYEYILQNKDNKRVKDNLVGLLPDLCRALIQTTGVKLDPAAGRKDKKIRTFQQIYLAVKKAHDNLKAENGVGLAEFPKSAVLGKEEINTILRLYGAIKRKEFVDRYRQDVELLEGFQNGNITFGGEVGFGGFTLSHVQEEVWQVLRNDPSRFAALQGDLSTGQRSLLYRKYSDPNSIFKYYFDSIESALTKGLRDKIQSEARRRAVDIFIRTGKSKEKDALLRIRKKIATTEGLLRARISIIKYIEKYKGIKAAYREKLLKKHRATRTKLEGELKGLKEKLKTVRTNYIKTLGDKFKAVETEQKLAILWKYLCKVVAYSKGQFPKEIWDTAKLYGITIDKTKPIESFKRLLGKQGLGVNLTIRKNEITGKDELVFAKFEKTDKNPRHASNEDINHARYVIYKSLEEKPPASVLVPEDYLNVLYDKKFLGSTLPFIYKAVKRKKAPDKFKEPDSYAFELLDRERPEFIALNSILRLAHPKNELTDPFGAFTKFLNGKLDQASWFKLFPDDAKQRRIQLDQMRSRLRWESITKNTTALNSVAKLCGATGANDPEFQFIIDIIKGKSRIVIQAPQSNGKLDENNTKIFILIKGKLTELEAGSKKLSIFQKFYKRFYHGHDEDNTNRLSVFVRRYFSDLGLFSPQTESIALELATNISRVSGKNKILLNELKKKDFKEAFFSALIAVLRSYVSDSSSEAPAQKFARVLESWYAQNRAAVTKSIAMRVGMNAKKGDKIKALPMLEEKLAMLFKIKGLLVQMGRELIRSGMLASGSNNQQVLNILNNTANITDRILFYLETDFKPLNLKGSASYDIMNKTQYYVMDSLVVDAIAKRIAFTPQITAGAPRTLFDHFRSIGIDMDGSKPKLSSWSSGHQWLYQQPAATFLLYLHTMVPGGIGAFDKSGKTIRVRNNIVGLDMIKLGAQLRAKTGDEKLEVLFVKAGKIMQKKGICFDNSIFEGMAENPPRQPIITRDGNVLSKAEFKVIQAVIIKLQNMFDLLTRITQPISGTQLVEFMRGRLKNLPEPSTWAKGVEAVSTLPAAAISKRMQIIDSDKTLALKFSLFPKIVSAFAAGGKNYRLKGVSYTRAFFEGVEGAGSWNGEMILRFVSKFGGLLRNSYFNSLVVGIHDEHIKKDPAKFLMKYAKSLMAKNKTISIGLKALKDTKKDKHAKLYLQALLTLWKPGMNSSLYRANHRTTGIGPLDTLISQAARELVAGRDYLSSTLLGMDDTAPSYNYSLRYKAFAVKSGYRFAAGFNFKDAKISSDMIKFGGSKLLDFIFMIDDKTKADFHKLFKIDDLMTNNTVQFAGKMLLILLGSKDENDKKIIKRLATAFKIPQSKLQAVAEKMKAYNGGDLTALGFDKALLKQVKFTIVLFAFAQKMKNYSGGSISDLGYLDRNSDNEMKRILVFFIRSIAPNFGLQVEGESDMNVVLMPVIMANYMRGWGAENIDFGSTSPRTHNRGFSIKYKKSKTRTILEKIWASIPGGMSKGLHFSLFIHPSIQLGLQTGFLVKLGRALNAGDDVQVKRVLQEWLVMRLSFFAFQYNPIALARNGVQAWQQGNYAEAIVNFYFAKHTFSSWMRLLQNTAKGLRAILGRGQFLQKHPKLASLLNQAAHEVNILSNKALLHEIDSLGKGNTRLRWTFRRILSAGKDLFISPLTRGTAIGFKATGRLHLAWERLAKLAQNPDKIISLPVEMGNRTVTMRIQARHLFRIFAEAMNPSVVQRAFNGLVSFMPGKGKIVQNFSRLSRSNRQVLPDTVALNAGNLTRAEVRQIMGLLSQEAQQIRHHGLKYLNGEAKGTIGKILLQSRRFFGKGLEFAMADQIGLHLIRDMNASLSLREHLLGGRSTGMHGAQKFHGKHAGNGLAWRILANIPVLRRLYKPLLDKPRYKNWRELYRDAKKHGLTTHLENEWAQQRSQNGLLHRAKESGKTALTLGISRERSRYVKARVKMIFDFYIARKETSVYKYVHEVAGFDITKGDHLSPKQFENILQQIIKDPAKLNELKGRLQGLDAASGNKPYCLSLYENLLKASQPAQPPETPPPVAPKPAGEPKEYKIKNDLKNAKIRFSRRVGAAFRGVSEASQKAFVEALKKGGVEKVIVGRGVSFANVGEAALLNFIKIVESGQKLPSTIVFQSRGGEIFLRSALQIEQSLLSFPAANIKGGKDLAKLGNNGSSLKAEINILRQGVESVRSKALARANDLMMRGQITDAQHTRMMRGINSEANNSLKPEILEKAARESLEIRALEEQAAALEAKTIELGKDVKVKGFRARLKNIRIKLAARTRAFMKAHGPVLGILLGLEIFRHRKEILKGNFSGVAKAGAVTLAGYGLFIAIEGGVTRIVSNGKVGVSAGMATATLLPALMTAYGLRDQIMLSGNTGVQTVALTKVGIEAVKGAVAFKAGAGAAKYTPGGPVIKGIAATAAAILTYAALELLEDTCIGEWLSKRLTKGQIKAEFAKLNFGHLKLKVSEKDKDYHENNAFFEDKTITVKTKDGTKKISRAQYTLAILKMVQSIGSMDEARQSAFLKQHGALGRKLMNIYYSLYYATGLKFDKWSDLDVGALGAVVDAVAKIDKKYSGWKLRNYNLKVKKVTRRIAHPLGGDAGEVINYKVYARADIGYSGTCDGGWCYQIENGKRMYGEATLEQQITQSMPDDPLGKRLMEVMVLKKYRVEQSNTCGDSIVDWERDGDSYSPIIAKDDPFMCANAEQYNLSLQDIMRYGMNVPFEHLDRFPIAKQQLVSLLTVNGYDPYFVDTNGKKVATKVSIERAYMRYKTHQASLQVHNNTGLSLPEYVADYGTDILFADYPFLQSTTTLGIEPSGDGNRVVVDETGWDINSIFQPWSMGEVNNSSSGAYAGFYYLTKSAGSAYQMMNVPSDFNCYTPVYYDGNNPAFVIGGKNVVVTPETDTTSGCDAMWENYSFWNNRSDNHPLDLERPVVWDLTSGAITQVMPGAPNLTNYSYLIEDSNDSGTRVGRYYIENNTILSLLGKARRPAVIR